MSGRMSDDSDEICEIELARQEVRYDMPPEEEQAAGYSTDGSTRPILPRPPAAAGEDNTTPPGDEIEEPRLTFKDVKNALSNSQFLTRTVFFAATAYFMVILQQRPNAPALMKHTPSITKRMQFEFSVEMVLAFSMVTGLHIVLQLLEFVYTSAPRITRGFALIGPWVLGWFVSSWMVMYTIHVPFFNKRGWQWPMTWCFVIVNLLYALMIGTRSLKIKENSIIEV